MEMLNRMWLRVVPLDGGWRLEAYDPRTISRDSGHPREEELEIFESRIHFHRFPNRKAAFRFRDRVEKELENGRDLDLRCWEAA